MSDEPKIKRWETLIPSRASDRCFSAVFDFGTDAEQAAAREWNLLAERSWALNGKGAGLRRAGQLDDAMYEAYVAVIRAETLAAKGAALIASCPILRERLDALEASAAEGSHS